MEKKNYTAPLTAAIELDSEDLLNGIDSYEDKVVIKPGGSNKGNANIAAGKYHYDLWGLDEED